MQSRLPVLVALATLALVLGTGLPPATAHGEHETDCDRRTDTWSHLGLWEPELAPGASAERDLSFEGCPLEQDWRLLLRGDVEGTLAVTLLQSGDELLSSSWGGAGNFEALTLPHTDFLTLRLQNTGDANATARLYFDQTCLCTVKGTHLVPGPVWLSALADAGQTVSFNVTLVPSSFPTRPDLPETVTVRAVLPGEPGATRDWTFHPALDEPCRDGGRWTACFEHTIQASETGRQDVLLWLDHDGDDSWSLSVRPVIEVEGTSGRDAPGPSVALALAPLAAVAVLARRSAR